MVTITERATDDVIGCSLHDESMNRSQVPTCSALSYVYGSCSQTPRIHLAGVTFSTGSNLHEALLRLALHQRLGPMLYAPLPIDSTSNTVENLRFERLFSQLFGFLYSVAHSHTSVYLELLELTWDLYIIWSSFASRSHSWTRPEKMQPNTQVDIPRVFSIQ